MTDPIKASLLITCVATSSMVVLRHRVCINRRDPPPEIGERWGTAPCGRGADPLEIRFCPTCVILPNLVVLGQTVQALLRRSA